MTLRAPSSKSSCGGPTPTGAALSYDNVGQLSNWQDKPSSPSSSAAFLYDGSGQRVAKQTMQGGVTTTTVYVGKVEEVATTGTNVTTTTNYYANGDRIATALNGAMSYIGRDLLGSHMIALSPNGTVIGQTLYAPYGAARYTSGSMPGEHGFTGQIQDVLIGLDYYGARYYDALAAQFASADTLLQGDGADILGLSRYAYVKGNPVSKIDPDGHMGLCQDDSCTDPVLPPPPADLCWYCSAWSGPAGDAAQSFWGWDTGASSSNVWDGWSGPAAGAVAAIAAAEPDAAATAFAAAAAASAAAAAAHRQDVIATSGAVNDIYIGGPTMQDLVSGLWGVGRAAGMIGSSVLGWALIAAVVLTTPSDGPASRQHGQNVDTSNQSENRKAEWAADKVGLNDAGKDKLHREISREGYTQEEVDQIAEDIYANYPKFRK